MFPLESKIVSNEVRPFRLSDVVGCSPGRLVGLGENIFFPNMFSAAARQFELSELLKQRMSAIDMLLELPSDLQQQKPDCPPPHIALQDEAEWWRQRISELSKPAPREDIKEVSPRDGTWEAPKISWSRGRSFVRAGHQPVPAPPGHKPKASCFVLSCWFTIAASAAVCQCKLVSPINDPTSWVSVKRWSPQPSIPTTSCQLDSPAAKTTCTRARGLSAVRLQSLGTEFKV